MPGSPRAVQGEALPAQALPEADDGGVTNRVLQQTCPCPELSRSPRTPGAFCLIPMQHLLLLCCHISH